MELANLFVRVDKESTLLMTIRGRVLPAQMASQHTQHGFDAVCTVLYVNVYCFPNDRIALMAFLTWVLQRKTIPSDILKTIGLPFGQLSQPKNITEFVMAQVPR
jgi:hypothetical protein